MGRRVHALVARAIAPAVLALAFLALPAAHDQSSAQAQSASCKRLQAQIAALDRRRPRGVGRYRRAAARQQAQLNRTAAYAQRIGCNQRRFLFFGRSPPPQCNRINARMARMQANLQNLQARINSAGESIRARRAQLASLYEARCTRVAARPDGRNFFDQLFGRKPAYQEIPVQPPNDPDAYIEDERNRQARRGSKAVCVRTCDGGFFPVSYSARNRDIDHLKEMCRALCPNSETRLFTLAPGADIKTAIASDGTPYTDLKNAEKFRKSYTPSCTCKRAGERWARVLQEAESILDNKSRRDLIVTKKKSEELSRPKLSKKQRKALEKRKAELEKAIEAERKRLEEDGRINALEAGRSGTAGIHAGNVSRRRFYRLGDGRTRVLETGKGVRKKVRVVGPRL